LLERHTQRRFGHTINAHLFRDCVASAVVNDDPNLAHFAARLLGHTGLRVTERNYIQADRRLALSRHHDLIRSMRRRYRRHKLNRDRQA
jgi:hypothetical protein